MKNAIFKRCFSSIRILMESKRRLSRKNNSKLNGVNKSSNKFLKKKKKEIDQRKKLLTATPQKSNDEIDDDEEDDNFIQTTLNFNHVFGDGNDLDQKTPLNIRTNMQRSKKTRKKKKNDALDFTSSLERAQKPQFKSPFKKDSSSLSSSITNSSKKKKKINNQPKKDHCEVDDFERRDRSKSNEYNSSSEDENYPPDMKPSSKSAFSDKLSFFSPQKKIPRSVSREAVVNTVFTALFDKSRRKNSTSLDFGDDDTGTETDEPNEDFVKKGLEASLFKAGMSSIFQGNNPPKSDKETIECFVSSKLIFTLINDIRFEDFRTASPRIDILRAIHKNFPSRRIDISRALADSIHLRLSYVRAVQDCAYQNGVEMFSAGNAAKNHDHGHGFTELLRYVIEHFDDVRVSNHTANQVNMVEILQNYSRSVVALCRAHCIDSAGTDEDELLDCAGQLVAYIPQIALTLTKLLLSNWPVERPSQEVFFIRILARVLMTAPPFVLLDSRTTVHIKAFKRLALCIISPQVQVAKEALAFTGSQFVLHNYVRFESVYASLSKSLHQSGKSHWNSMIQEMSDNNFDIILDFAP